jgi:hypothetical protein
MSRPALIGLTNKLSLPTTQIHLLNPQIVNFLLQILLRLQYLMLSFIIYLLQLLSSLVRFSNTKLSVLKLTFYLLEFGNALVEFIVVVRCLLKFAAFLL